METPPVPSMLFVYGTLMKCASGYPPTRGATFVGYGHTVGGPPHGNSHLQMFESRNVPMVVENPYRSGYLIWGELWKNIDPEEWTRIVQMESAYTLKDAGGIYIYSLNNWTYGAKMWIYSNWNIASRFEEVQSGSWRNLAMQGGRALPGTKQNGPSIGKDLLGAKYRTLKPLNNQA